MLSREATRLDPVPLWRKNAEVIGMSLMTSLQYEHARTYADVATCIARVARGELRVPIDRAFPLAEAAQAHAYVESRASFGRVIMVP